MQYYVYIMSNKRRGVIYVGVTNNLIRRVYEHKNSFVKGFTKKYRLKNLVFYEITDSIFSAIQREKNLKHWVRSWKIELIESVNPYSNDGGKSFRLVSRPLELPHRPLAKRCGSLSTHTASIKHTSLPIQVSSAQIDLVHSWL